MLVTIQTTVLTCMTSIEMMSDPSKWVTTVRYLNAQYLATVGELAAKTGLATHFLFGV